LETPLGEVDFSIGLNDFVDDEGGLRGKVICFSDVDLPEKRREDLLYTMRSLQSSRDMIKEQNEQLKILATRDPLTDCWNRRSFFEEFYDLWEKANRDGLPLSVVMLDIDHFKNVNDHHGHAMGDDVLKQVAAIILKLSREEDVVCRYGGEEFCMLLPGANLREARGLAEGYRKKIEEFELKEVKVTVSQGVSCTILGGGEPEELLEQADQSLYVAKRSGRNRVISFNEVPDGFSLKASETNSRKTTREKVEKRISPIPFQVVSSLMSVLNHRDPHTAAHCVRVADLSFSLGQGLLSASDLYALEVGALLHDIGKIAVPDSLLLKPERLTCEEIQSLRRHSRIGCELIEAAFHATPVADTVRYAGCSYAGTQKFPGMLKGEQIPVSARIVTIADAYDSMVTPTVYREKLSREQAIEELYRCAGTQFDPGLVERFVDLLKTRPEMESQVKGNVQFTKDLAMQLACISGQITKSFDEQDFDLLRANAQKLEAAAHQYDNPRLSRIAEKLVSHSRSADGQEVEVGKIMEDVIQLLTLCHVAQQELLQPV
ncbi:MAG: diguanylate cyclase, partial [Planctomycetota bacterium]|nr:diguanylate cyclase [Planctomycetota bacterium]